MQRYAILEIPVDAIAMKEAVARAGEMLESSSFHHIITLNPEILLYASRDASYAGVLQKGSMALPDGIGLVWMGRLLGIPFKERVTGVDFMIELARLAEQKKKSVFFIGGRGGAAEQSAQWLSRRFPGLIVRGWSEDTAAIPDADIVFVALGAPRQEQWIAANRSRLPGVRIAIGVGGAFDMLAGKKPRAPRFMQAAGLEWLWRFLLEPRARCARIYNAVIIFPCVLLAGSLWKR